MSKRYSYSDVNVVTNGLVESIKVTNMARDLVGSDNICFTLGYIQSMLNNIIADLPVTKQNAIIREIMERTKEKMESIV